MTENIFKNKKPDPKKLIGYGFKKSEGKYEYKKPLAGLGLELKASVEQGRISAHIFDITSGEEYILHLTDASGSFVGEVRSEYERVLREIANKCFEAEVFKNPQTKRVITYIREKYGDEPEYLWEKTPNNAIVRRKDSGKWYAALLTVKKDRLGFEDESAAEIIDLRARSEDIPGLVDDRRYFPGWHMNKKHWITAILDDSISDKELFHRIDESYISAV